MTDYARLMGIVGIAMTFGGMFLLFRYLVSYRIRSGSAGYLILVRVVERRPDVLGILGVTFVVLGGAALIAIYM